MLIKQSSKVLSLNLFVSNQAINYFKKHQHARERYQIFTEEEKDKKREYGCERYKNLSEDEKQRLYEYRKIY